jgi:hypothetical protein
MNTKHLAGSLAAALALVFSAHAAAETYSFGEDDIVLNSWLNPFDDSEFVGFRVGVPLSDGWDDPGTPPAAGEIGFTAFHAKDYEWDKSTIVFGFAASSDKVYTVDWANSWLTLSDGSQFDLGGVAPVAGDASLAANAWGGGEPGGLQGDGGSGGACHPA